MSAMKCPSLFELPVVSLAKGYGEGRKSRLPSPQRGRGAGGEGEFPALVGCVPSRLQQASPTFIVKSRLRATPPHPQPLSPSLGGEGRRIFNFFTAPVIFGFNGSPARLGDHNATIASCCSSRFCPGSLRKNPACRLGAR